MLNGYVRIYVALGNFLISCHLHEIAIVFVCTIQQAAETQQQKKKVIGQECESVYFPIFKLLLSDIYDNNI